jgi:hypothetical protein
LPSREREQRDEKNSLRSVSVPGRSQHAQEKMLDTNRRFTEGSVAKIIIQRRESQAILTQAAS